MGPGRAGRRGGGGLRRLARRGPAEGWRGRPGPAAGLELGVDRAGPGRPPPRRRAHAAGGAERGGGPLRGQVPRAGFRFRRPSRPSRRGRASLVHRSALHDGLQADLRNGDNGVGGEGDPSSLGARGLSGALWVGPREETARSSGTSYPLLPPSPPAPGWGRRGPRRPVPADRTPGALLEGWDVRQDEAVGEARLTLAPRPLPRTGLPPTPRLGAGVLEGRLPRRPPSGPATPARPALTGPVLETQARNLTALSPCVSRPASPAPPRPAPPRPDVGGRLLRGRFTPLTQGRGHVKEGERCARSTPRVDGNRDFRHIRASHSENRLSFISLLFSLPSFVRFLSFLLFPFFFMCACVCGLFVPKQKSNP